MIPFVGISQQKFIIKGDTLIAYTLKENRKIALLFLEGDYYKRLTLKDLEIIAIKDSIISVKDYYIEFSDSTIKVQKKLLEDLNIENNNNKIKIAEKEKKLRTTRTIASGSILLNIILLIILV